MTTNVSYRRKSHHHHHAMITKSDVEGGGSDEEIMNHHDGDNDEKKMMMSDQQDNNSHDHDHHRRPFFYHSSHTIRKLYQRYRLKQQYGYTISISCLFIMVGMVITFCVIHYHHHTIVIFHDSWHHGKAVLLSSFRSTHYYDDSNDNDHHHHHHHGGRFYHHYYLGSPKFVTVVLPSVVNPKERKRRLEAIHATWGSYARAIFVVHNVQEEFPAGNHLTIDLQYHQYNNLHSHRNNKGVTLPSDPYSYPQNLLLPSNITFDDGLPRLYYTIRNIYEYVNPDYAFFVNDHTYVIPEHLCYYLEHYHPDNMDIYHGHALRQDENNDHPLFNSGAAGYILSRRTMKKLIDKWDEKDPICYVDSNSNNLHMKWIQGNPGLVVTECLASMNITAIDTRLYHKYHRFHAFPLTRIIRGNDGVDEWYVRKHDVAIDQFHHDETNHNYYHHHEYNQSSHSKTNDTTSMTEAMISSSYNTLLTGPDCCSEDTISFHYVEAKECRALFTIRNILLGKGHHHYHHHGHNQRQQGQAYDWSKEEMKELLQHYWPQQRKEIGFYSKGLPSDNEEESIIWDDLIHTIQKISIHKYEKEC